MLRLIDGRVTVGVTYQMVRLSHAHLHVAFGRCCCCYLESLDSLDCANKQRTLLPLNDNIQPNVNSSIGQQDMVSISAEFPAIDQTAANQEEVEVLRRRRGRSCAV